MTWEQKIVALSALTSGAHGVTLWLKAPGSWIANATNVRVGNGATIGTRFGSGPTPEDAVENLWNEFTDLKEQEYIVLNDTDSAKRRHLKWNGFMWAELPVAA